MLPRVGAKEGAEFATWRALLNVNNQQPNPAVAFDTAAGIVQVDEQDVQAKFRPIGMGYTVTQDAVDLAKGYADAKATMALNTLNQLMIGEDKLLIGAQSFALPVPGTPTVTPGATGGSIAASTAVDVRVAARTGSNYFYGGSGIASAQGAGTTSTGATNSAVAFVTAVPGAVAYDWFVNGFYYTTTTVNTVTITSIPTANQALPTNLPDLSTVAPTSVPTVDASANATEFDGFLASLSGNYASNGSLVTNGTGTPSGATFLSNDGATLTLSGGAIQQFDELFLSVWNNVRLSPDALMLNGQQAQDLATRVLGSPGAVTYLQTNAGDRNSATAGGRVGGVINKITGKEVAIEVHPHLPSGTIIARTDTVPFPGSNIGKTLQIETLRDYSDFTYGSSRGAPGVAGGGPREDGEIRSIECFKNLAPVAMAVLSNVAAG